jgi:hypothetical protein
MKVHQYKVFGHVNDKVEELAVLTADRCEHGTRYYRFYLGETLVGVFDVKVACGFKIINSMEVDDGGQ